MHLHFSTSQLKTAASIWRRGLKSSKRLTGLLVRAVPLIVGANSLSWVKAAFVFSRFVTSFIKCQGQRGLAIYLKAANVSLMRALAGKRIVNPRDAGAAVSLSNSGFPRVIPGAHRLRMAQGDVGVIRLWLGFFTLYRVLEFRGKLSLRTITDPGVYLSISYLDRFKGFSKRFKTSLVGMGGKVFRTDIVPQQNRTAEWLDTLFEFVAAKGHSPYGGSTAHLYKANYRQELWGYVVKLFPLMKSGPNSQKGSISVAMLIHDVATWFKHPALLTSLVTLVALTRQWHLVDNPAWVAGRWLFRKNQTPVEAGKRRESTTAHPGSREQFPRDTRKIQDPLVWKKGQLGRLSIVEEPGKMRVVAMVDCWTQWFLYPLHRFIFDKLLRVIPQDGTFDQLKPVKRLIGLMREKRPPACFSFDLSAATDRIPLKLQQALLGEFLTDEFAHHWGNLLVGRQYATPPIVRRTFGKVLSAVSYSVGQPMGAYSSWAMLALVHHAIIQWAAERAGRSGWFELYAVLGDDVVIGDRGVADEYVLIMEEIGVKIGFSKSIISNNLSIEFAKRFFYRGTEVTPLPLVGIAVGWLGVSGVPEIMKIIEAKTGKLPTLSLLAKALGFGFKACSSAATSRILDLPRMLRSIVILLSRPGQVLGVDDAWQWVRLKRYNSIAPATKRWYESVSRIARQRIIERDTQPVARSLYKAFVGFGLPKEFREEVVQLTQWWADTIVKPYKQPMLDLIEEFKDTQLKIKDEEVQLDDVSLVILLERLEHMESLLTKLPKSVDLFRNMLMTMGMARDRQPKSVRLWRKLTQWSRRS
jgi:hypothetical protein